MKLKNAVLEPLAEALVALAAPSNPLPAVVAGRVYRARQAVLQALAPLVEAKKRVLLQHGATTNEGGDIRLEPGDEGHDAAVADLIPLMQEEVEVDMPPAIVLADIADAKLSGHHVGVLLELGVVSDGEAKVLPMRPRSGKAKGKRAG